jgi:aminoglycoside 6'-N-acetyltransferase
MPPTLTGRQVVLRPLRPDDGGRLARILAQPEVARWWGTAEADAAANDLFDTSEQESFAIELQGELIGSIQFWEEDDPDYRHAAIDLFLDAEHQGYGLGPDALRTLGRYLLQERGHHRLTIDPALDNERAIRAYESVGFHRVGVMRSYERGPDGSWHDNLLLDLLAGELR